MINTPPRPEKKKREVRSLNNLRIFGVKPRTPEIWNDKRGWISIS